VKKVIADAALIGMSVALLWLLSNIWRYGQHLVGETNIVILSLETAGLLAILVLGVIKFLGNLRGAKREVIKMPGCEYLATCPFFNDSTYGMPEIYKDRYCRGDYRWCVRYMVFKAEEQKKKEVEGCRGRG